MNKNYEKIIEVVPYDPGWPHIYEKEAALIQQALGDNCLAIHHIGSTAVPGLAAKPKIDMIVVVQDAVLARDPLEQINTRYKGEYNIPLRYFFTKREDMALNLHIYEKFHPEIALNLCFRDYLRTHTHIRDAYATLKQELIQDPSSFLKENGCSVNYTLRKGDFIREVLRKAGFNKIRMVKCNDHTEWIAAKRFRETFGYHGTQDFWALTQENQVHLVLYRGVEIIGYSHIQFLPDQKAQIALALDQNNQNQGFESTFLELIEIWLKRLGMKSIVLHKMI